MYFGGYESTSCEEQQILSLNMPPRSFKSPHGLGVSPLFMDEMCVWELPSIVLMSRSDHDEKDRRGDSEKERWGKG